MLKNVHVVFSMLKKYKWKSVFFKKFFLWFFSLFALLLAVVSVLFFIPVLAEYFTTGLVLKFPTLIVCGFVMLAAIQSFFAGLMLSNSAQKNRRDFEYRYTLVCEKELRQREEK